MSSCEFIGRTTLDMCYLLENFPEEDRKISANEFLALAGGPAANGAATFAYLGGEALLTTAVGKSPWAKIARDDLARARLDIRDACANSNYTLPVSSILTNRGNGSRTIINTPIEDAELQARKHSHGVQETPLCHLAMIDGFLFELFQDRIRDYSLNKREVIFDGGSWRPNTKEVLSSVTIAICSERFSYEGREDQNRTIELLHSHGIRRVAITRGENSIIASEDGHQTIIAVPQIQHAIDTLGAGDIFHGAFCYYFSQSKDFVVALRKASVVAAISCESFGTRAWMTADAFEV
jgi:sugar/nucleoside kinase (ribokinase family)